MAITLEQVQTLPEGRIVGDTMFGRQELTIFPSNLQKAVDALNGAGYDGPVNSQADLVKLAAEKAGLNADMNYNVVG